VLLNKLTIGSSLESAVYAYLNDAYFLPTSKFGPMFYEETEHKVLLTENKALTWSRLQLLMGLMGKLLNYENIQTIKVSENNIKISSESGVVKYKFGTCNIFDPTGVQVDNQLVLQSPPVYKVYDDFEISHLGGKHKYLQPKLTGSSLAQKIYFYISDRVDGADYVTDCVAESLLTSSQLHHPDYSDAIVKIAIQRYLTSIGINGNFMNLYKNGTPKYRKPKVTHKSRTVVKREMNKYVSSEKVKFLDMSLKEIFNEFSPKRP